jgi:16S rRNA (guanine(1405)-N(7))-methyltransferase
VDVAFLLKAVPCLEQMDRHAGATLLDAAPARHVLVSFPVHSLGGRQKGMPAHYEAHLRELVADRPWEVRRFEFTTELAFLITKA